MKTYIKIKDIDVGIITIIGNDLNDAMNKVLYYFYDYPYNTIEIVDIKEM